eukprot:CAMPEP_0116837296 /NCGR_PEP_ID=MMETSP0418-20121206/8573_1 /TAXON_ID=1158023 /ORGANISM="Astrosyne radiata, Strain 13vi08-1A" /LENGTH=112 /DNA_ID=CAMNT_0004467161 /DNA_START=183 /DNA_END=521 /DNA_ORIENTATION=+
MCLIEVAFLGGLPIQWDHYAVAPLWGVAYIYFSWWMANKWDAQAGPQYCYPFLDTTLGWMATISLMVLLVVLLLFYALCAMGSDYFQSTSIGFGTRILSMIVTVLLVCRFRD